MTDPVDEAIAAPERRATVEVTIASSGRVVMLNIPADLSDVELLELSAWTAGKLRRLVLEERRKPSPILVARSLPS